MKCTFSVVLKDKTYAVPCGRCIACRVNKSAEWSLRIVHETLYHDESVFLTMTFNDENRPFNKSLSKRDVQLFMKRFRKSIYPRSIMFYASGEYGKESLREHYHLILFGISYKDFKRPHNAPNGCYTSDSWPYGFIYVGTVESDSARYVADYTLKSNFSGERREDYIRLGLEPPFSLMSQGIGKRYALDYADILRENLYIVDIKGRVLPIPRYYRKVIGITDQDYYQRLVEAKRRKAAKHGPLSIHPEYVVLSVEKALKQAHKNHKAKFERYFVKDR